MLSRLSAAITQNNSCNFNVLKDGILPKQIGLKDILNNPPFKDKLRKKEKSLLNKIKVSWKNIQYIQNKMNIIPIME